MCDGEAVRQHCKSVMLLREEGGSERTGVIREGQGSAGSRSLPCLHVGRLRVC